MKNTCRQLGLILLFALSGIAGRAQVFADLSFSGGNGAPLSITLNSPLHFTLSGSIANEESPFLSIPLFVFKGAGNLVTDDTLTGSFSLSINGTPVVPFPPGTFDEALGVDPAVVWGSASVTRSGVVAPDDLVLTSLYFLISTTPNSYGDLLDSLGEPNLFSGGYFDLGGGTLTTSLAFAGALPADGLYEVYPASFLGVPFDGITVSGGAAVPEPSTYAAWAGVAVLGAALVARRRKHG
ncbi:MAG: hypothetical protein JSS11_06260 [Verrucomicrobia bacterium]|nr:hypothetical protein [Verrucomicrobiota bacterium]